MQVEDHLYQKDLYSPLVGEKPEAVSANEWAILDRKTLATIRLSQTPQVAFNISKENNIVAMKVLEKLYKKPSASNKVFLIKSLFNMRMSKNDSLVDHLYDFNGVTNQLKSVAINFDDEIRALLFLCSLPDSLNNLVTTVSNSTISGMLTLNDVVSSVMNDEMLRLVMVYHLVQLCLWNPEVDRITSRITGEEVHRRKIKIKWQVDVQRENRSVVEFIVGKGKVDIKLSSGGTLVLNDRTAKEPYI
ncbi:hypothetical protein RJ639_031580 [Escallonia herrerae]|uniref:Retrovirus-related Pol polyprotein from transposon TNT 1-94 n=1 Tax=Escallonia herrerae TaxID=1293975 RepID=A0AA89BEF1_9ASTE|nr:hypothetical protein RJ639_031580 [Escallonia herrerae]